jgi:hypothetical protein
VSIYQKREKRGDDKDLHPGVEYFKKRMLGGWRWFLLVMIPLGLRMGLRIVPHLQQVPGMGLRRMWKVEVSWTCLLEGGARGLLENRRHLARIVEVSYFFVKLIRSVTV